MGFIARTELCHCREGGHSGGRSRHSFPPLHEPARTRDAVLRAAPFVGDEPFGVLLGDDITVDPPCSAVLKAAHERLGGSAIALSSRTTHTFSSPRVDKPTGSSNPSASNPPLGSWMSAAESAGSPSASLI